MATIYFTNTAHTGDGTLRQALLDAQNGDVVEPDPSVFGAGETVSIAVASPLEVAVGATLRAGATRLTLLRTTETAATLFSATANATGFVAEDVAFVGRVYVYSANATFRRCRFNGNAANAHLLHVQAGGGLTLYDCAVYGGLGRGVYVANLNNGAATIVRSTIAGNASACRLPDSATIADSIVDPVCSAAGFIAPPPDSLDASQALPWDEWDLRLLPTSQYATNATSGAGEYDADGNERGRYVAGTSAKTYAVGAYEVVEADYYQKSASSESFNDPDDWRTGAGATPAAITSGVFYLDESATWRDAPPTGSTVRIAGRRVETFGANVALARIETGLNSAIELSGVDRIIRTNTAKFCEGTTFKSSTRGYFAAPTGTPTTGATFSNVVACASGAGITSFNAYASDGYATIEATLADASEFYLIEANAGAGWETVTTAGLPRSTVRLAGRGAIVYRGFDGVNFWTDTVVVVAPIWTVEAWSASAWNVTAWAENLGGGDADKPAFSVKAWGVAPQIEHR